MPACTCGARREPGAGSGFATGAFRSTTGGGSGSAMGVLSSAGIAAGFGGGGSDFQIGCCEQPANAITAPIDTSTPSLITLVSIRTDVGEADHLRVLRDLDLEQRA